MLIIRLSIDLVEVFRSILLEARMRELLVVRVYVIRRSYEFVMEKLSPKGSIFVGADLCQELFRKFLGVHDHKTGAQVIPTDDVICCLVINHLIERLDEPWNSSIPIDLVDYCSCLFFFTSFNHSYLYVLFD